ncbi:hypothetical protein B0H13DRAFT_1961014 [Mycena leptocephala]|nr:hypothetical protein B0H13DRAFT_1961014 [Mycena leptocephala]
MAAPLPWISIGLDFVTTVCCDSLPAISYPKPQDPSLQYRLTAPRRRATCPASLSIRSVTEIQCIPSVWILVLTAP